MKRYVICLFLFIGVSAVCLTAGYFVARRHQDTSFSSAEELEIETIGTAEVTESAPENLAAANRSQVRHETVKEEYYLVSEDGFLLVFGKDKETICLYTHIPLLEFPEREQERLREGIWFPSMMEVIHYLESYTS
jgi:hypothetical protein